MSAADHLSGIDVEAIVRQAVSLDDLAPFFRTEQGRQAAIYAAAAIGPHRWVTAPTAARMLGVNNSRVHQLKRAGVLPAVEGGVSLRAVFARIADPPAMGRRPQVQGAVLGAVADADGPVTGAEVAAQVGRSPSAATQTLRRLEQAGHVEQVGHRNRSILWALTDQSRVAAGRTVRHDTDAAMLASLDDEPGGDDSESSSDNDDETAADTESDRGRGA